MSNAINIALDVARKKRAEGGDVADKGDLVVYRAGGQSARYGPKDGPTFFAESPAGAAPYGSDIRQYKISPKKVFDTSYIEHRRQYEKFRQETGHPGGYMGNHPAWTTEPELNQWLRSKGHQFDAIKFGENTGVPSYAVYNPSAVSPVPSKNTGGSVARQYRAEGGETVHKFHSGPIHSAVAGRTDHLPITVASGSYVLPADAVSHLGESNTLAGFKVLRRMFGGEPYGGSSSPYGQSSGPYGAKMATGGKVHRAAGILFVSPEKEVLLLRRQGKDHVGEWALPAGGIEKGETPEQAARRETEEEAGHTHEGGLSPFMHSERQGVDFTTFIAHAADKFKPELNHEHDGAVWIKPSEAEKKLPLHPGVRAALEKLSRRTGKAHGGEASGVPIVAAGGEWVIPPHHVEQIGAGDMDAGHRTLDKFVLHIRKEQIEKLKHMSPPRKD